MQVLFNENWWKRIAKSKNYVHLKNVSIFLEINVRR